jgi:hypothetical protein
LIKKEKEKRSYSLDFILFLIYLTLPGK